jgi:hypothetical protein
METELGDFNDNLEVFSTALCRVRNGFVKDGMRMLRELRDHIILTGESKSVEWLLPKLDIYLSRNSVSVLPVPEKFGSGFSSHLCV